MATPGTKSTNVNVLQTDGNSESVGGTTVTVLRRDDNGYVVECSGTTVPTDGGSGYAKGCTFTDTSSAANNSGLYENLGTASSCQFYISGLLSYTKTITSAVIGTFDTASVTIVPSVSGKVINVLQVAFSFSASSTAYAGGGSLGVFWGATNAAIQLTNAINSSFITNSAVGKLNIYRTAIDTNLTAGGVASMMGTPIILTALTSSQPPYTTGAGILTVTTRYYLT